MTSRMISCTFALLAIGWCVGCTHFNTVGEFTVLSSHEWEQGAKYVKQGSFEGRDVRNWVLYIGASSRLQNAVDSCLRAGNGDLLTNVKVSYRMQDNFFWGDRGWVVNADVWKRAGMGMAPTGGDSLWTLVPSKEGFALMSDGASQQSIPILMDAGGRLR